MYLAVCESEAVLPASRYEDRFFGWLVTWRPLLPGELDEEGYTPTLAKWIV